MTKTSYGEGLRLVSGGALVMVPPLLVFHTYAALYVVYGLSLLGAWALVTRWSDVDRATRAVLLGVVVVVLSAFATYLATGAETGGWRYFESMYAKLLAIVPLILVVRTQRPSPGAFWWGALLGSFASGIAAVVDVHRAFGFDIEALIADTAFRAGGGIHPVIFGMLVATMTLIAACGRRYFTTLGRWAQALWLLGVASGSLATLLSNTRGAWLALLVALGITLLLRARALSGPRRLALAAIVLLTPVVLYQVPRVESRVDEAVEDIRTHLQRAAGDKSVTGSIGPRFEMWRTAVIIANQYPWFGAGLGTSFQVEAGKLAAAGEVHSAAAMYRHAHSQYFNTLATRGRVGLVTELVLMLTVIAMFVHYWRQSQEPQRGLAMTGLLVTFAYLAFGMSDVPLEHKNTLVLYVYLTGVLAGLARSGPESVSGPSEGVTADVPANACVQP